MCHLRRTVTTALAIAGLGTFAVFWYNPPWAVRSPAPHDNFAHIVDLGEVAPDTRVSRLVRVPNHTGRPLTIKSIAKDCTCILDEVKTRAAAPGESFEIVLGYRAPKVRGTFSNTVHLTFHETDETYAVFLNGEVGGWCDVVPESVRLLAVQGQAGMVSAAVVVTTRSGCPPAEFSATPEGDIAFAVESGPSTDQQKHLTICLLPRAAERFGTHAGHVRLRWQAKGYEFLLPVTVEIQPAFEARPAELLFEAVRGENCQFTLDICTRRVESLAAPPAGYEVRLRDVPAFVAAEVVRRGDRALQVTVSVRADQCPAGFVNGRLELVQTGSAPRVVLTVPLTGRVRSSGALPPTRRGS